MESFAESMIEFKAQLEKGYLQEAYAGLMDYFRDLRNHFQKRYPDYSVPSNIYYGYMDMTYFSVVPEPLKTRKLKIAIVFVFDSFRFEVWLSGANRDVQKEYWRLIQDHGWYKYHLASDPRREDFVLNHLLVNDPDFGDLEDLTAQIESGTLDFIADIEEFLATL